MAHDAAYTILENIRLRLTAKMTKLPLGKMLNERIGKLKNLVIDQVETIELPLSHLIPEGYRMLYYPSLFLFTYSCWIGEWPLFPLLLYHLPSSHF